MIIEKLAWIELQNGKILSTLSKGKSVYYIPGGKREKGENDQEALLREIEEELSVSIIPSSMEYMETFEAQADGKAKGVIVKMICYKAEYKGDLQANSEIDHFTWLSYEDIDRVAAVDKIIFNWLKERKLLS
ncbi:MAG: NUDIX domain-containing protein [Bacteroidota bacterium]